MDVKVFRSNETDMEQMSEAIKYWCNGLGELHHHGQYDITEDELPLALRRAYNELWDPDYGSYCYLVETEKGYGVALICEYHECFAEDCKISMDSLFETVQKDASVISGQPEFKYADLLIGEYSGGDYHELIVVFPAEMPVKEFKEAAKRLDEIAYQSAKEMEPNQLQEFTIRVKQELEGHISIKAKSSMEALAMADTMYNQNGQELPDMDDVAPLKFSVEDGKGKELSGHDPANLESNLREIIVLTCKHETKHGIDIYTSLHANSEEALAYIDTVKEDCDFDETNYGEYFDADFENHVVDFSKFSKFQPVKDVGLNPEFSKPSLAEQIASAQSKTALGQDSSQEIQSNLER